jgi:ribose transport system substrate-binding protein
MKRTPILLLVLVMVMTLFTGAAFSAEAPKDIRLASHNAIIEGNPYRVRYEADIQEAAAAAAEHGFNVSYASFVSNWDAGTEAQQIRNSINEGYDIILVNPVSATGMDPLIEAAQEAGILYINADCIYTSPDVNILNVATDQYYLGYHTGSYAGKVLGEGAKVVMMAAMEGVTANTDRQNGFQDAIKEYGLEVVANANHNWDAALATQLMTEILNSGVEFDGVLTSQCAEAALIAFDATGTPYPKFMGFNDTQEWMKRMIDLNKDEVTMPFMVLSNPPGVGASALNFGLNMLLGKELRDDIFDDESIHSILLPSKIWFNDENMDEHLDLPGTLSGPDDAITYWLTVDEVAAQYFK